MHRYDLTASWLRSKCGGKSQTFAKGGKLCLSIAFPYHIILYTSLHILDSVQHFNIMLQSLGILFNMQYLIFV